MTLAQWYVVLFCLGTGVAMAGYWSWVLATGALPALISDRALGRAHVAAELLTAALLIAGGVVLLVDEDAAVVAALGTGALLYALVSSPALYPGNRTVRTALSVGAVFAVPAAVLLVIA